MITSRSILPCSIVFATSLWITLLQPAIAQDKPAPPNFLFVFVDDQPWNGTSVAMQPGFQPSRTASYHMPNLERIASNGMVFSQAYASHPKCECSRAALLMGRSTTSLNAVDKRARDWKAPPSDSLANSLKLTNSSYRAAHFGKWQWHQPELVSKLLDELKAHVRNGLGEQKVRVLLSGNSESNQQPRRSGRNEPKKLKPEENNPLALRIPDTGQTTPFT